jgi:hypothetical protein
MEMEMEMDSESWKGFRLCPMTSNAILNLSYLGPKSDNYIISKISTNLKVTIPRIIERFLGSVTLQYPVIWPRASQLS